MARPVAFIARESAGYVTCAQWGARVRGCLRAGALGDKARAHIHGAGVRVAAINIKSIDAPARERRHVLNVLRVFELRVHVKPRVAAARGGAHIRVHTQLQALAVNVCGKRGDARWELHGVRDELVRDGVARRGVAIVDSHVIIARSRVAAGNELIRDALDDGLRDLRGVVHPAHPTHWRCAHQAIVEGGSFGKHGGEKKQQRERHVCLRGVTCHARRHKSLRGCVHVRRQCFALRKKRRRGPVSDKRLLGFG